jgi:hypothetical protein
MTDVRMRARVVAPNDRMLDPKWRCAGPPITRAATVAPKASQIAGAALPFDVITDKLGSRICG